MRVYFSHFIAKQGTIVKDICYRLGAQFCSVYSPVVRFTMDMQTGHLEDRDHARVFLLLLCTMKFFREIYESKSLFTPKLQP